MNLDDLVAIDVHAHAEVSASGRGLLGGELERASARYFRVEVGSRPTLDQIAGYYRQRRLARRLVGEHGIRGFKFHPNVQEFHPNDRGAYRLYEAIQELGVPVVFHRGQTGIGAGCVGVVGCG